MHTGTGEVSQIQTDWDKWFGMLTLNEQGAVTGYDPPTGFSTADWLGGQMALGGAFLPDPLGTIPEPSTWLLLGAGPAFIFIMRRRRQGDPATGNNE